jgi:nucleotide-binding universal stress UspA family protein
MNVLLAVDEVGLAEELLQNLYLPDPSYVAVVAQAGGSDSADIRKRLKEVAERQRRPGVEASTLTLTGDPTKSILKLAAELPADLVVLGVAASSEDSSALAARLVHSCQCPVGVARTGRQIRNVVLAANHIEKADRCLDFLSQFPWPKNLTIVAVSNDPSKEAGRKEVLEHVCARLKGLDVACTPRLEQGQAASAILKVASEVDAELIVVGSRELSAPARLFLGSVSGQVMSQATCNVLVVRGRVSVPLTTEDQVAEELV